MENLEPKKERSPIESLKFQRKSDYKKFRNFIKKETKELKGITAPKEDKLKSILKVGVGGLGFLAIGGLVGARSRVGKDDGVIPKFGPFAIGRRNLPQSETSISPNTLKAPRTPKVGKVLRGTRTTGSVIIPRSKLTTNMIEVKKSTEERRAVEKRSELVEKTKDLQEKRDIKKRFSKNYTQTKQLVKSGEVGGDSNIADYQKKNIEAGKNIVKQIKKNKPNIKINPLKIDPLQAFKSADESLLSEYLKAGDPEVEKIMKDARKSPPPPDMIDDFYRGQKYLKNRKKPISRRFKNLREGVMGATDRDPSGRVTGTLGENKFKGKGSFAKFTRRLMRGNPKMTKDTSKAFFGMGYKGKGMSLLGTVSSNPLVKAGFFILDAYAAYTSGKQVFNLKDNIGTALYDLYVSINNTINENDPDKLKYYISESSDKNMSIKQRRRNIRISEIKGKYYEKISGEGGNNIIVVPETKQNNEVKSTIPIKKGGEEVSFVPFEPVNSVGTDILLHKLNQ